MITCRFKGHGQCGTALSIITRSSRCCRWPRKVLLCPLYVWCAGCSPQVEAVDQLSYRTTSKPNHWSNSSGVLASTLSATSSGKMFLITYFFITVYVYRRRVHQPLTTLPLAPTCYNWIYGGLPLQPIQLHLPHSYNTSTSPWPRSKRGPSVETTWSVITTAHGLLRGRAMSAWAQPLG